ncbi:MAG: glycosyltransferase family 4 protein [Candidatus Saccharibacteria bacterium]|nr:glycosyltransferase family 4 protein [Candidatus Saccharibacteria bacterium]
MKILWLSWKDEKHPQAGGAEVVSTELRKRLVRDGNEVILLTTKIPNSPTHEIVEGVDIYRIGGRYSVYISAKKYFKKNLNSWPDLIIDEMNTIPFMGFSYSSTPTVLLTYQLAREVWFYQMFFPVSIFGYLIEPLYLRCMSKKYLAVLTESQSTKKDLTRYGFREADIDVFRVGMYTKPIKKYIPKKDTNKLIYLGSVRPMKRTLHLVKAFELAKNENPNLKLDIIGDWKNSKYGTKVHDYAEKSRYSGSIVFHGKVSQQEKDKLLSDATLIAITSIKEGWGLIATEAAAYGVSAVAYDSDGLRDSVLDQKTGILVPSGDIKKLASVINKTLNDRVQLEIMGKSALENSRQYTFENSYSDFLSIIYRVMEKHEK